MNQNLISKIIHLVIKIYFLQITLMIIQIIQFHHSQEICLFLFQSLKKTDPLLDSFPKIQRFGQVYSRRREIQGSTQNQNSDSSLDNILNSSPTPSENQDAQEQENSLPIALRKLIRECIKLPLYPSDNFLSYHWLSSPYHSFLISLDTTTIPNNISEALSKKEWKLWMMKRALEKKLDLGFGGITKGSEEGRL